jgi:hypothetical protein
MTLRSLILRARMPSTSWNRCRDQRGARRAPATRTRHKDRSAWAHLQPPRKLGTTGIRTSPSIPIPPQLSGQPGGGMPFRLPRWDPYAPNQADLGTPRPPWALHSRGGAGYGQTAAPIRTSRPPPMSPSLRPSGPTRPTARSERRAPPPDAGGDPAPGGSPSHPSPSHRSA